MLRKGTVFPLCIIFLTSLLLSSVKALRLIVVQFHLQIERAKFDHGIFILEVFIVVGQFESSFRVADLKLRKYRKNSNFMKNPTCKVCRAHRWKIFNHG